MGMEEMEPVIACPWHGWEFDVKTGHAIWDPSLRIRTFPVTISGGRVLIETAMVQAKEPIT
jgi:nitrite reductase/ring-hydroxylating ferredoxin subunit